MPLNIYMIEKNDWRLHPGDEQFYSGLSLKKIKFPEFWQTSYREKNAFYDMIVAEAKDYFVRFKQGEEFLRGEKVQILWHAHCQFCWQKFTTDMDAECYCTPDYRHWICHDCFEEFKDTFNFTILS